MSMWDFTQVVSFKKCGNVIFAPEIQKMLSLGESTGVFRIFWKIG